MLNVKMSVFCLLEKLCNDYNSGVCFYMTLVCRSSLWKTCFCNILVNLLKLNLSFQTLHAWRTVSSKAYSFRNIFAF